jgi:homoserine dehydrogenase
MMLAQQPLLSAESKSIVAVVNATLNCIQTTEAIRGDKAVLANIRDRGVCEQGESSLAEIVERELNDVAMKAVILWNHEMGAKRSISLKKSMFFPRKRTDIAATILNRKWRRDYRMVVCIADSMLEFHNHIEPFMQHQDKNLMLRAGLINLKQMRPGFSNFFGNFPDGIECKLVRIEGYRKVAVSGDGGGRRATVAAMFEDATRFGML